MNHTNVYQLLVQWTETPERHRPSIKLQQAADLLVLSVTDLCSPPPAVWIFHRGAEKT